MAIGLTDRPWELADILNLVDSAAPKPNRPAHYRPRKTWVVAQKGETVEFLEFDHDPDTIVGVIMEAGYRPRVMV